MDLAECVFNLLQWAQYGDVPEFKPAAEEAKKDGDNELTQQGTNESEESGDDEILDESAFEEEGKQDAWAEGVVEAASKDPLADLPEMDDPTGLSVTLRPYQRQALCWMWKRETDPANRAVVEQELKLLSELARNKASSSSSQANNIYQQTQQTAEVSCDCGPVLVSEAGAAKSTTVDGDVNPVTHPLWQRRYLACDELKSSISFYVNELLGVASAKSPNPPKQCVGGIEADAMGLGKTVMLLALMLKSKIEEGAGTTLVVAPLSLIAQWEEELASKTNLTHKIYYGDSAKIAVDKNTFKGIDVVVTTCKYEDVSRCFLRNVFLSQMNSQTALSKESFTPSTRRQLATKASCHTTGFVSFWTKHIALKMPPPCVPKLAVYLRQNDDGASREHPFRTRCKTPTVF